MAKFTSKVSKSVIFYFVIITLISSLFCGTALARARGGAAAAGARGGPRGGAAEATPVFGGQPAAGAAETIIERKYAPDRNVDILHIIIDATPDFKKRSVEVTTTIKFSPIAKSITELKLDAIDLMVSSVTGSVKVADYDVTDKNIIITFARPLEPGKEASVTIKSKAFPERGMYFRTPELGYKESDIHLFTQGEQHEGPYWYPNYDYPNERSTSEVIFHVPQDFTVISNGRLVSEQVDKKTGLKAVRWIQEKPHVNYLIAVAAGKFEKVEGKHKNIPLAFYTTPSNIKYAQNSFKNTAKIMDYFEKEIDFAYPWNKYDQVTCEDFVAGGMENTTLTILADRAIVPDGYENLRSNDGLVSHEMSHQWFGDYVTCKDWANTWINEGFATYYAALYDGYANGRDSMLYTLNNSARGILSNTSEQRSIVNRAYRTANEQFDSRNYQKGSWVLHMLRCRLGEDLYRKCVKELLVRHGLSNAITEDFISIIEEFSGRSWDRFFDEYVRLGRFPELTVSYEWLQGQRLAKVTVEQTQRPLNGIEIYHIPVIVRFVVDGKYIDKEILIDSKREDFYIPLSSRPSLVLFDPELTLLASVTFRKPRQMLYEQLADKSNCIVRIQAIQELARNSDAEVVNKLKDVLDNDPFYGVRLQAATSLGSMDTDESFQALTESIKQRDARVRQAVIRAVSSNYKPEALEIIQATLNEEKNPAIVANCINALGLFPSEKTKEQLTGYLISDSFRSELASSAITAIRRLDDVSYADVLMDTIKDRLGVFPTSVTTSAMDTLAYLRRNDEDKTKTREFLTGFVSSKNPRIQQGAIQSLGTLGDVKALAMIESLTAGDPQTPLQRAANTARDRLNAQPRPFTPSDVAELASSLEQMKTDTQRMQQELEDLKKQISAAGQGRRPRRSEPNDVNTPTQTPIIE